MDLYEAIRNRRSIRAFKAKPIPDEKLFKILDAAHWAPSAGNLQPWEFIIVKDQKLKEELAIAAVWQMFIAEASVVIVVCANQVRSARRYGSRGRDFYSIFDAALATQNLLLAAHAEGLGACAVGAFDEEAVREILKIPAGVRPVLVIPIGYPDEKPEVPERYELERLTHYNRY